MNTTLTADAAATLPVSIDPALSESVSQPVHSDVISQLVEQIRDENERIQEMVERQRQLRLALLRAQEESLAALRPAKS